MTRIAFWILTVSLIGCGGSGGGRGAAEPANPAPDSDDPDPEAPGLDPGQGAGEGEGEPAPAPEPDPNPGPAPAAPSCDAFGPGDLLLERVHAALSAAYEPIDPEEDRGGELNRYTTARHLLFTKVERHGGGLECVYTGRFVETGPDEEPDNDDINCEHVWPRDRMVDELLDPALYEHQQSDMHHLFPSDARTNSARGSLHFGEPVADLDREYAPATIGEDAGGARVFAPREERRGDVARAVLYYSARWGADIAEPEEAVLRSWADADPPDDRERARNDAIEDLQGNRNPFVDCPGVLDDLPDFVAFEVAPADGALPLP